MKKFELFLYEDRDYNTGNYLGQTRKYVVEASWRRERDSNPRCLSTSLVFKTSAINRSAISPCITSSISIAQKTASVKRNLPGGGKFLSAFVGVIGTGGYIANLRRKSTVQGIPFLWQYML